jgi:hypothetical protein
LCAELYHKTVYDIYKDIFEKVLIIRDGCLFLRGGSDANNLSWRQINITSRIRYADGTYVVFDKDIVNETERNGKKQIGLKLRNFLKIK